MIQSFRDQGSADVFVGEDSKAARKCLPIKIHGVARRKLDLLEKAVVLIDLAAPAGLGLQALKAPRQGQHAVKINDQYRICFRWTPLGPAEVEITDYH